MNLTEYIKIHHNDNVAVALQNLKAGTQISFGEITFILPEDIQAKHKFTLHSISKGQTLIMYGIVVGTAKMDLMQGAAVKVQNVEHQTSPVVNRQPITHWEKPPVNQWQNVTFKGYHRKDGSVGTANYWLVFPLVFCENKNIEVIKEAINDALGYNQYNKYKEFAKKHLQQMLNHEKSVDGVHTEVIINTRPFENVDGVKFITHQMGCGCTRQDAQALCGLLAGYLTNPNVAGATVLSLGCQNAQFEILRNEILARDTQFDKPLFYFDQQTLGTEDVLIEEAIKATLEGMALANKEERKEAPLSKLVIGLECGGSDGFSGISANPTVGYVSDMVVALGGTAVLAEFPELCGVEQELCNRCVSDQLADTFLDLMHKYEKAAIDVGSGFDMNPSPGNIKDGLITDAMKSAGAAKKGGISPVTDVLDYPQKVRKHGLNLLNTPGNDVESTTALAGSGCNIILFTTGLGTPTGNPVVPVIKISSNTALSARMSDIIDFNAGTVIEGKNTIGEAANQLLDYIVKVASGEVLSKATINQQNDFIPWKRGVSL
jgi:altronate hydrolase